MIDRKELKRKALFNLRGRGNYPVFVLAGLVSLLISNIRYASVMPTYLESEPVVLEQLDRLALFRLSRLVRLSLPDLKRLKFFPRIEISSILVFTLITIFVILPLTLGIRRLILYGASRPEPSDMVYPYKLDYLNCAWALASTNLIILAHYLLLIVPGIIKQYEYALVPWLITEYPGMKGETARTRSRAMMEGHKMELFRLQLSLLGWELLGLLTAGFAEALFVRPYVLLVSAEFYRSVSGSTFGLEE